MKCLILAAGYATRLYPLTRNFPKPLLKVGDKTILDWLVDDIEGAGRVDEYVIISNHRYAEHFAAWVREKRMNTPITVLDDGTESNETRLGAVKDIQFAIEKLELDDDLLVIAGDNVLDFSLTRFIEYFDRKRCSCVMRYAEPDAERLKKCGVVELGEAEQIRSMEEKPAQPKSKWCVPPFYLYTRADSGRVAEAIRAGCPTDAPGSFVAYLSRRSRVCAMEMPGKRYDIGNLQSYEQVQQTYRGIEEPKGAVLVTGGAGFIGFHLSRRLLEKGMQVVGFDNLNDYYDVSLKESRLEILKAYPNYRFVKGNLAQEDQLNAVFEAYRPEIVVNLAAQAGVRYSIDNPRAYIDSNIVGFFNVLEACRHYPVRHLLYASSSSVYGNQKKTPFSTRDNVDRPISLYAATKKSDELMAYTYAHLYGIAATGLRFFTVYGPYGRPDMAYFKFADRIAQGQPIQVYNGGDMYRDFTYVDDIVTGMETMLCRPPKPDGDGVRHKVYNIGNNRPEKLMDFIAALERALGKQAKKEFLPMQPGDVYQTFADVDDLMQDFGFKPAIGIEEGLNRFADWYKGYYKNPRQGE